MESNSVLILLSSLVIVSYLFDLFSRKTRFPSVLILLLSGIGLRLLSDSLGLEWLDFLSILPTLGTIGLILIVLEGSLELTYRKDKNKLILRSFLSALFILLFTAGALSLAIHYLTGYPFRACLASSIPFSVISSSIAIPSALHTTGENREFVIYESSFSDILGIVFFNFVTGNEDIHIGSLAGLALDIGIVLLLSALSSLLLLYILSRLRQQVRFFLVISILVLVYALGKLLHLPSLVVVLVFGLFLANARQIQFPFFRKHLLYPAFRDDLHQLFLFAAESAFLVRTFFFILFGFIIDVQALFSMGLLLYGLIFLACIYAVRFLFMRFVFRISSFTLLLITPRGLISIILYLGLPESLKIPQTDTALLFLVILATNFLMALGLAGGRGGRQTSP